MLWLKGFERMAVDVSDSEGSEKSRPSERGVTVLDQDDERVPSEEEILEYAEYLGIDVEKEKDLLWIAREGVVAPVPGPWKACTENGDDVFYFNFETGESIWDHPSDEQYRQLLQEKRKEKAEKASSSSEPTKDDTIPVETAAKGGESSKIGSSTPTVDTAKEEVEVNNKLEKDPNSSASASAEESFSASASLSVSEKANAEKPPETLDKEVSKSPISQTSTAVSKGSVDMPSAGVGLAGVGLGGMSLGGPSSRKKEPAETEKKCEVSLEEIEEEDGLEAFDESTSHSAPMTKPEAAEGIKPLDQGEREPSEEDIQNYAKHLGIDLEKESDLLWIAREGIVTPAPWKACSENGDVFYLNSETGTRASHHPSEEKHRELLQEKRKEKAEKAEETETAKKTEMAEKASSSSEPTKDDTIPVETAAKGGESSKIGSSTPTVDTAKEEVEVNNKLEKDPNSSASASAEESFSASASLSVSEKANAEKPPETLDKEVSKSPISQTSTAVSKGSVDMPSAGVGLAGVGLGGMSLGGPSSRKKEPAETEKKCEVSLEEIEEEDGLEAFDESTSHSAPMTKPEAAEAKGTLGIAGDFSASELSEDFMSEGSPNSSFVAPRKHSISIGDTLELSYSASVTADLDLSQGTATAAHPLEAEIASLARSLAMLQKIREHQRQYLELLMGN